MGWKIRPTGHDPRQIDLLAALALVIVIIAAILLVAQRRDTTAIQAKLDRLMITSEGENDLVGLDNRPTHEIEKIRADAKKELKDQLDPVLTAGRKAIDADPATADPLRPE